MSQSPLPMPLDEILLSFCRWLVGVSYRVSFGSDPIANAGGGVFGSFASVPGAIHLDEAGDMDVSLSASSPALYADHALQ